MTVAFPFDEVRLTAPPAPQTMTPAEFFAMPLAKRLRFIIAKTAVFLSAGIEVDSSEALAQLRSDRVAS